MDDFIMGTIEATKELGLPFVSESIWTEAMTDIFFRGGRSRSGSRVWNDDDTPGTKVSNAIGHLVEAQMPLSAKQFGRLGLAFKNKGEPVGVVTKGKFNEYGETFELGNEALGIAGLRRVDVDPEKSFHYKITDYKTGVSDSRNLFTAATLKGGIVSPKDIVDAYINANRALYESNKVMYKDIQAAKTLGMTDNSVETVMDERGAGTAFDYLSEGTFKPYTVSDAVEQVFEYNANALGVANPLNAAQSVLDRIADVLELTSLSEGVFPDLDNPFSVSLGEAAGNIYNAVIPPQVNNNFLGAANVNINQAQGVTPNFDQLKNQDQKLQRISNVNSLINTQ